ncbi:Hypothetical predicted protein [Podarcis lilfordi]|uniref:Uncharacterized protein n=1 Tax=Podarcis lilfordi TaxID=74358 RepID=A0AA35P535_9SAUR|nr:Hypothetical predicted protein [Podarcis lilfordi]
MCCPPRPTCCRMLGRGPPGGGCCSPPALPSSGLPPPPFPRRSPFRTLWSKTAASIHMPLLLASLAATGSLASLSAASPAASGPSSSSVQLRGPLPPGRRARAAKRRRRCPLLSFSASPRCSHRRPAQVRPAQPRHALAATAAASPQQVHRWKKEHDAARQQQQQQQQQQRKDSSSPPCPVISGPGSAGRRQAGRQAGRLRRAPRFSHRCHSPAASRQAGASSLSSRCNRTDPSPNLGCLRAERTKGLSLSPASQPASRPPPSAAALAGLFLKRRPQGSRDAAREGEGARTVDGRSRLCPCLPQQYLLS